MKRPLTDGNAYHLALTVRDASKRLAAANLTGLSDEARTVLAAELGFAISRCQTVIRSVDPARITDVMDAPDLAERLAEHGNDVADGGTDA